MSTNKVTVLPMDTEAMELARGEQRQYEASKRTARPTLDNSRQDENEGRKLLARELRRLLG